jgi:pimeloyl-ACP methyl ester carboxylesterase
MLAAHGYGRAAVVAHSYGTTIASRLVIKYPQLVHSMCLTDPVSRLTEVCGPFVYVRKGSCQGFVMHSSRSGQPCCRSWCLVCCLRACAVASKDSSCLQTA